MQNEECKMQNVMILFDGMEADADMILVPDGLAMRIDAVAQEFFRWASDPATVHDFWLTLPNGRKALALDTKEFVWYLNHHAIDNGERAEIVAQHIPYDSKYPTAYF